MNNFRQFRFQNLPQIRCGQIVFPKFHAAPGRSEQDVLPFVCAYRWSLKRRPTVLVDIIIGSTTQTAREKRISTLGVALSWNYCPGRTITTQWIVSIKSKVLLYGPSHTQINKKYYTLTTVRVRVKVRYVPGRYWPTLKIPTRTDSSAE